MGVSSARKVLVAEDNPALAGVVRFNLKRTGFEVTVARNGREALDMACRTPFDVVITDQQNGVLRRLIGQALRPV